MSHKMDLVERIKALKEEESVQVKASKLYKLSCEFVGCKVVGEIFDDSISSRAYVEDSIYSCAVEGNLQSIKNKIEEISDFSVSWYKNLNENYYDLDKKTVDNVIYDILNELEG